MLKLSQLRDKLLVTKDSKDFIIGALSIDDELCWNIYPFSWQDGIDGKPFFTESADWYIVVRRKIHEGTEWEEERVGFLNLDLLLVALNVNGFEIAESQRY